MKCQKCNTECYTNEIEALVGGQGDPNKPHDVSRCMRCKMGYPCRTATHVPSSTNSYSSAYYASPYQYAS